MAEVIGTAIFSALATAGVTSAAAGATVVVAGVTAAQIVGTAAIVGGSIAVQALTAEDSRQKVAAQQYSSKQSLPARRRSYGRVKLAGPYLAWGAAGGLFLTGSYLGEGPYDAIEQIYLDDSLSTFASGATSGIAGVAPWQNAVALEARLGASPQTASSLLKALPYWSDDHRADGCAYIVMQATAPEEEKFKRVYPSGSWPATRAVLRAAKVRNPNVPGQTNNPATWAWTDLCTPCIRDILVHPEWGMAVPADLIDDVSFAAEAAIDAQTVLDRDGNAIPRFRLSGSYDLTDEPADALQNALDACGRDLYLTPEGKIGITGGRYVAPSVTIGQDAVLSVSAIEVGSGKRASFNRLNTSFVSPDHDFQMVEGAPWIDTAAVAAAGETLERPFSRPWVTNHNQLARLAKKHMALANPDIRIAGLATNRKGLPALFEDSVNLDLTRYGINGPFKIERAVASGDGATCVFDLVSIDPGADTFDAALEEGEPPTPLADDTTTAAPTAPAALTLALDRRAVNGGINAAFLRLTATPPARADQSLIGRYRRVGDTAWLDMVREGSTRGVVLSAVLVDGYAYEAQGAIAGYGGANASVWANPTPSTITVAADGTAPAQPTLAVAQTAGTYGVTATATAPDSANTRQLKLSRANGFTKVQADAAQIAAGLRNVSPNQQIAFTDTADLGYLKYFLQALNGSGVAGTADAKTLLVERPPINRLSSADDLTNAAWTKTRTTAAVSGGNAPGGTPWTLVSETAVAGSHLVVQSASGLTSGSRVRASFLVKAAGRSRAALYLQGDTSANAAIANFNLDTLAVSASPTVIGTGVSNADVRLIPVSADAYLFWVSANLAFTTAIFQLAFLNDAGSTSYTGDTAKGMYFGAGAIGVVT